MGFNVNSSTQSKKASATKNSRTHARQHYKSRTKTMNVLEAPAFEEVSNEDTSANDVPDVEASVSQAEARVPDVPEKEISPSHESSSSSKYFEPENEAHQDVSSEESSKAPPSIHEI